MLHRSIITVLSWLHRIRWVEGAGQYLCTY